jgi:predicted DNA-binding transcriptional regulator AlpA
MPQKALKSSPEIKLAGSTAPGPENERQRRPHSRADEERSGIPNEGYMRLPAVLSVFPVSKSTWWAGISAGRFPKGVKLGPRITAWKVDDIRKLIESLKAA